ncbi:MAG: galactose mutarotase [Spirochaetaceae bacterium]|nr:galactose mutarotase [Spirochaetaceae bacterium]
MKIKERLFGVLSGGEKVRLFTISNSDMSFSVTNFGCTITSIILPSRSGRKDDITLGFSTLEGYVNNRSNFGCIVGRFANRIGNAEFNLNGKTYSLDKNIEGKHTLHSGWSGYDARLWEPELVETKDSAGVRFSLLSENGDQGFPGNLTMEVTYLLNKHNEIEMHYRAKTDRDTPVNLTNHSYFNLRGSGRGTILDHEISLNCDSTLEVDENWIPTGKLLPVEGTAWDFRTPKTIGQDIAQTPAGGYDECFVVNRSKGKLSVCANVHEPVSGRRMIAATNQPGVQFYTGNYLSGIVGKLGVPYEKQGGFCLETQQFPDAPNKPEFPDSILHAGEVLEAVTVYGFSW